jgi:hypothetical protein
MYAFQFQDGTWRVAFLTNSRSPRPRPRTEAYDLCEGSYASRREANAAIDKIRALVSESSHRIHEGPCHVDAESGA